MKAYKKHLSQQQDLQQQEQRNSCFGIRKPVVWDPYHRRASVEPSSGDFTAAMSSLPPSSRPSRERFRGRSASLGRLHYEGQPDTAEEPRLQPAHLAAFSTFSWIYVGISQLEGQSARSALAQSIKIVTSHLFFGLTSFLSLLTPAQPRDQFLSHKLEKDCGKVANHVRTSFTKFIRKGFHQQHSWHYSHFPNPVGQRHVVRDQILGKSY